MRALRGVRARLALSFAVVVAGSLLLFGAVLSATQIYWELEEFRAGRELDLDPFWYPVHRVAGAFLVTAPLAITGAAYLGFALAHRALAPMREANAHVKAARASELDLKLPVRGVGDEWDQLALTLNGLLADARASLERVRRFTGDAAHELRTPVTAIVGTAEVALRRERPAAEYAEALRGVHAEGVRLAHLVDALLLLARADGGVLAQHVSPTSLEQVACEAVSQRRVDAESLQRALQLTGAGDALMVRGDPTLLGRALGNLLDNALCHGEGVVSVRLQREGARACVEVRDEGAGIPTDLRPRLFSRFARADMRGSRKGSGLGLSITRAIAEAHGGTVRLAESPRGARFVLELPLA